MKSFGHYLGKVKSMTPKQLWAKVWYKSTAALVDRFRRFNALHRDNRTEHHLPISKSFINVHELNTGGIDPETAEYLCKQYCAHRFDLLGSGWQYVGYGAEVPGLEGRRYDSNSVVADADGQWLTAIVPVCYVKKSKTMWRLIQPPYKPIDWQRDFKSGYQWSARQWYRDQYVSKEGVDIKVPWELSRMQHLPQMAIFATLLPQWQKKLITEFKNQVLDFISANPPGLGVNWACTMDVGIRAVNLLIAYDLMWQYDQGNILDNKFLCFFSDSMYDHGIHIIQNLEWDGMITSNHYLANVCGLLFIAAYLPRTRTTLQWLGFADGELIRETDKQFYEDGGNFEASTSYHRLSGEMVVYSAALLLGLKEGDREIFSRLVHSQWHRKPVLKPLNQRTLIEVFSGDVSVLSDSFRRRLFRMGQFTKAIIKPDGQTVQIGDNDSGRFLRLSPAGRMLDGLEAANRYINLEKIEGVRYWDENHLDHRTFLSALGGICPLLSSNTPYPLESSFTASLARNNTLTWEDSGNGEVNGNGEDCGDGKDSRDGNPQCDVKTDYVLSQPKFPDQDLKFVKTSFINAEKGKQSIKNGLVMHNFADFGLTIFRSNRLFLAFMTGPIGQNGNGGHAHNDKLSFELMLDGKVIFADPGTCLYTPLPERRNEFRSVQAHNGPFIQGIEPDDWLDGRMGLFSLKARSNCHLTALENDAVEAMLQFKQHTLCRRIEIQEDGITVTDKADCDFEQNLEQYHLFSSGYGKLEKWQNING